MTNDMSEYMDLAKLVVAEIVRDKMGAKYCEMVENGGDMTELLEIYIEAAVNRFEKFREMLSTSPDRKDAFIKLVLSIA